MPSNIARRSLPELETQRIIAQRLGYLNEETTQAVRRETDPETAYSFP
ncbi:MAG: four helix bundle protein [Rhodothermales bacterium]